MAEVNLSIHGKSYSINCDEGQEQRVVELGKYVDSRLRDIAGAGAAVNDCHLLILTALVLADESFDLRENMHRLQNGENVPMEAMVQPGLSKEDEEMIANAIAHMASRIDDVASRLQELKKAA